MGGAQEDFRAVHNGLTKCSVFVQPVPSRSRYHSQRGQTADRGSEAESADEGGEYTGSPVPATETPGFPVA